MNTSVHPLNTLTTPSNIFYNSLIYPPVQISPPQTGIIPSTVVAAASAVNVSPLSNSCGTSSTAPHTGKKRGRSSENDVSRVVLSRENSLKYSSMDYEALVNSLSMEEPLTSSELREMKKQRRLIKNREYAQTSRNKKKEQFELLTVKITQLNQQNVELFNRVIQLETENYRLQEENRQLQLLNYSNVTNIPASPATSVVEQPPSPNPVVEFVSNSSDDEHSSTSENSCPVLSPSEETPEDFTTFEDSLFGDTIWSFDSNLSRPFTLTLTAVFFCMLLFFPSLSFTNTFPGNNHSQEEKHVHSTTSPENVIEPSNKMTNQNIPINPLHRNLLEKSASSKDNQSPWPLDPQSNSHTSILTMDDVIEDESKSHISILSMDDVIYDEYISQNITVQEENQIHSIYLKPLIITQ